MKYKDLTLGIIEAVFNKLGGLEGAQRFLRGELLVKEATEWRIPTWKILTLRVYESVDALHQTLETDGVLIREGAGHILKKVPLVRTEETVELVAVLVEEMGLANGATTREIYNRAAKLGLDLCPPQAGAELCIAYHDQPIGMYVKVAMKQIISSRGYPYVFFVGRDTDGSIRLKGDYAPPKERWCSVDRWVFVRRK